MQIEPIKTVDSVFIVISMQFPCESYNVYSVLSININMLFKRIGFSVKSFVYLAWLDNIIPQGLWSFRCEYAQ